MNERTFTHDELTRALAAQSTEDAQASAQAVDAMAAHKDAEVAKLRQALSGLAIIIQGGKDVVQHADPQEAGQYLGGVVIALHERVAELETDIVALAASEKKAGVSRADADQNARQAHKERVANKEETARLLKDEADARQVVYAQLEAARAKTEQAESDRDAAVARVAELEGADTEQGDMPEKDNPRCRQYWQARAEEAEKGMKGNAQTAVDLFEDYKQAYANGQQVQAQRDELARVLREDIAKACDDNYTEDEMPTFVKHLRDQALARIEGKAGEVDTTTRIGGNGGDHSVDSWEAERRGVTGRGEGG